MAGPLAALGTVWVGCALNRTAIESAERARITRRFRAYHDPALVDHILEHPEEIRAEGEKRELTVVFTDLADFTATAERLEEQTIPLLNEYMGRMVPIIRKHRGTLNKFLGDGIMFFYGAPIRGEDHAERAVTTVLEMQEAVLKFDAELSRQGLGVRLRMRAGICSGKMMVGDAGSVDASDYTVLGDTVNLGARLESANKATGTLTLINGRAAELLGDRFLVRTIGKLQVVGKTDAVMTYEVICPMGSATDEQKRLVKATAEMVNAFMEGRFEDALAAADRLDQQFGPSKLAALYRDASADRLAQGVDGLFDGRIRLIDK